MTTFKEWFIFLMNANLFWSLSAWSFSFELTKPKIQVGESTFLKIHLPLNGNSQRPIIFDDLLTQNKNLKLLEHQIVKTDSEYEISFELTAHSSKKVSIPPIQIQLGPDTFSTETLALEVWSSRDPNDTEIRAEFEPLQLPIPWKKLFSYFIWSISGLCFFWILRRTFSRIPWKRLSLQLHAVKMPNLESNRMWLKRQLKRIRSERQNRANPLVLADDLSFVLKTFLERQTHTPALSWTAQEIVAQLPQLTARPGRRTVLAHIDSVRYQPKQGMTYEAVIDELIDQVEKEFLK
ncbi:hypothetical protein EBR78_00755 [bacterium]|nr:hypothetical protein [bacterium]NBX81765.1 hypothetical protein [bacterium]